MRLMPEKKNIKPRMPYTMSSFQLLLSFTKPTAAIISPTIPSIVRIIPKMRFSIVPCLFMTIAKNSMPKRVKERLRDSLKQGAASEEPGGNSVEPSV